jgi:hypothetical protein
MPRYLRAFGLGFVGIAALAVLMLLLSSTPLDTAFGSAAVFVGTSLLLVGGLSGGGYSNIGFGAAEAVLGRRRRFDDDPVRESQEIVHDPMARLRRGLRPPPNPKAFWQVIAGCLYIALGIPFAL